MTGPGETPDWPALRAAAVEAAGRAYAPYSRLQVGVAALTVDGRLLTGCNVENASYGLTLCAECGLVSALHASGGGQLAALACRSGDGELLMPCGRCRQLLWEHGGPRLLVDSPRGPVPMTEVLPDAFGEADLPGAVGGDAVVPVGGAEPGGPVGGADPVGTAP